MPRTTLIFGANGGIGAALAQIFVEIGDQVWAFSRAGTRIAGAQNVVVDPMDGTALKAQLARIDAPVNQVVVATGGLHDAAGHGPEKTLRALDADYMQAMFTANTMVPAMIARQVLPALPRNRRSVFAALSARVGSISDNHLGGWHSYRASKAALNMLIRGFAIEMARTHPQHVCLGLHPGTVDTNLSRPFQANVPEGKLFTPAQSAQYLAKVLERAQAGDTGKCFDWAGKEIPA